MTDVLIKRELLERLAEWDQFPHKMKDALTELRAILSAPRQPEGEGLEIRALEHNGITVSYRLASPHELRNGAPLCRLSDAQRAIAELRELIGAAQRVTCAVIDERDTLRQQRDKLAGLLREAIPDVEFSIGEGYKESAALFERINAALAEVKPCPESLHPAAT